jgi:glycosyltransferase involved in cell wall biosynthesis
MTKQTALIFRECLLPPSETFIADQARHLERYQPVLAGLRTSRPSLEHGLPQVLLSNNSQSKGKLIAAFFRETHIAPGFYAELIAQRPTIVHAHFATDAVQAMPIARKLNVPLIVSLHGFDVTSTDDALRGSALGRNYLANRLRLFEQTSVFLCVSDFIRSTALRAGFPQSKLCVHYTGIDCDRFHPATAPRDPKKVVFVGRLVEKKGCEHLIRAMKIVQRQDREAHMEVIGDGPLRHDLQRLAISLAVNANFRGLQPPTEVQSAMAGARVLCNPSVTAASGDKEGFGMVFAEAQAVGTPVVSFAHAAIPEAVIHGCTGLLCKERSVEELADSILTLLGDEDAWATMSRNAVLWVRRHFDIRKQNRVLEAIYDRCIGESLSALRQ